MIMYTYEMQINGVLHIEEAWSILLEVLQADYGEAARDEAVNKGLKKTLIKNSFSDLKKFTNLRIRKMGPNSPVEYIYTGIRDNLHDFLFFGTTTHKPA